MGDVINYHDAFLTESVARFSAPTVQSRLENGVALPMLVWRYGAPMMVASTASAGGGLGLRSWAINAQVADDYDGENLAADAGRIAAAADVAGDGSVMFTAARVEKMCTAQVAGVRVDATVGVSTPAWAAISDDDVAATPTGPQQPGTINIVVRMPVRLTEAALLGALCTVTEAKTQALLDADIPGTGTPSDAVTLACPSEGEAEQYAGTRSIWGAHLARATYRAVAAGLECWA